MVVIVVDLLLVVVVNYVKTRSPQESSNTLSNNVLKVK